MTIQSPLPEQYVRLWTTHAQRVYAYILSLLPHRADADEVFQEVSMTVWMKFDQFEPGSNFRAWAYRIALNKVREFHRSRHNEPMFCDARLLEIVDRLTVERSETLDNQYRALADCLGKLHPRDLDLVRRRYRVGATPRSVSQQVGRSLAAVYKALGRIHGALFDCVRRTVGAGDCS